MDILDFSFDAKQDYSYGNDMSMHSLVDIARGYCKKPQITYEKVAMLEKEICASRYAEEASVRLLNGVPDWFQGYLLYFGKGVIEITHGDPGASLLDRLWERRFQQILPIRQVPKLGGLLLRLLVPAMALLFFAAAAGVFLMPDLLPDIREHSAGVLTVLLGVILVPVSLIFSFVGLIFAVGILGVLSEQIGPWLEKQGPWLQNWLAPMALALVLVVIGILLLLWSKKLRAKPLPKRKLPLSPAKRAMAKRKLEEAEKFLGSCSKKFVLFMLELASICNDLREALDKMREEGASPEMIEKQKGDLASAIYVAECVGNMEKKYSAYIKRLEKMKAEL